MKKGKNKKINERVNRYYEIQEIRAVAPTEEEGAYIEGLAIPYGERTSIGGWFEEIIMRGALDGADLKDVPLFIHHQGQTIPLARSRNNNANSTMKLSVTERGLEFKAKLDIENNSDARALYSSVKRQDITGMSFAFRVKEEKWLNLDTDLPTREIHKFDKIYEISALWSPQYETSNVMARDETLDSVDKLQRD
jgi:HK97 family phage prohead protease